jgi:hypothetical protein
VTAPPLQPFDPSWTFNPPPMWTVPRGYDPRLGHLPDPTWPPPPVDWVWWVPNVAMLAHSVPPPMSHGRKRMLVAGGSLVGLLIVGGVVADVFTGWAEQPATGVGSCWTPDGNGFVAVSCKSGEATYTLVGDVKSTSMCPRETTMATAQNATYICLAPIRRS